MKCNACWGEIEGRGVATTCGHIFCAEDANKILSSESSCLVCEQLLSKSQMKAVDLNPSDDWINMAMAGVPPHLIMKCALKGIAFWIGQKDIETQLTVKKAQHLRQRYNEMQAKFVEKMELAQSAYQKAVRQSQSLQQEVENLNKDRTELQEKYSEKSRQKRKLEEMYDNLRIEFDKLKQSTIQPSRIDSFPIQKGRVQPVFSEPSGFEDLPSRHHAGASSAIAPVTPDFWPATRPSNRNDDHLFDMSAIRPATQKLTRALPDHNNSQMPEQASTMKSARLFSTTGGPSNALRNLLLSPMKRPLSRLGTGCTYDNNIHSISAR